MGATEILVAIVVTAVLLAFAAIPFLKSWTGGVGEKEEDIELDLLLQEKERIYTGLADLDFDYVSKKISDEDYQKMREEFVQEGVLVLNQIDRFKKKIPLQVAVTSEADEVPARRGRPARRGGPAKEALKPAILEDVEAEIAKFKKTRGKRGESDIEKEIARFKRLRKTKTKR